VTLGLAALNLVALGLAALGLAACGTAGAAPPAGGRQNQLRGAAAAAANPGLDPGSSLNQPAPPMRLVNQFGQPMSLSQFHGKVVILAFTDSQCTTICPLTTASMVTAKALLGRAGDQVQLLGVDANPKATAVPDVMAYSRVHGMVNQWDFLTGSPGQLAAVWRAYHMAVQIDHGQIDHTPALFVIDQQGRERKLYLTQMAYASIGQAGQLLAQEVASLLPGHPALTSYRSLAQIPGLTPASRLSLPGVGQPGPAAGPVPLGPGQPRLVMFFATWVAETSDLRARLLALNSYVARARNAHLPGLVAVDEQSTEPSTAAVAAYLRGLGKPLAYPVALDAGGRLADGYGVQDQPWFALVNASGKIVWHHDGWLSLPALEAAARKA
jgi:cytochrome oxidase Cu insertion factor (SCO1/SenC/PrrC family)